MSARACSVECCLRLASGRADFLGKPRARARRGFFFVGCYSEKVGARFAIASQSGPLCPTSDSVPCAGEVGCRTAVQSVAVRWQPEHTWLGGVREARSPGCPAARRCGRSYSVLN